MAKVICFANQKGGVGKTTSTNALAMGLKHKGYRVLCIDFDPQGNLSFSMDADTEPPTIYDVVKRKVKCRFAIRHTEMIDIIPSNLLLSSVEVEFTGNGREFLLKDCIKQVSPMYDYILIDSPPELGVLTVNAFTAADVVLVPVLTDVYSLQGITRLYDTLQHIKRTLNPTLKFGGMLLVRYSAREELSRTVLATAEMVSKSLQIPLLKTHIRSSVMIAKAQAMQKDMMKIAPQNHAVMDYMQLTEELLRGGL
ncbi:MULTISPECIES: ParA family protein [Caproicibacterium]|uniref:Sporulation initiation inhibitor protein Soj n=1 Tax=Caproicibacterium argilliputei TaxID=3030016 RepID=A0AA97H080_9FIRM|nr:AAA family ATPase [Caproicibacterium argilliputei]WOC31276.1 AAA family ATPase [Caproicibacterium argilliputei]